MAIVGVGNNCSALLQGWARAKDGSRSQEGSPSVVGGYCLEDIKWVSAFDVSEEKIGKDLSQAIHMPPNNFPILEEVPTLGTPVLSAPLLDGLSDGVAQHVRLAKEVSHDVKSLAAIIQSRETDVLLNLVPAGSPSVARLWARVALEAGCAFVNATPDPIAQDPTFVDLFSKAGLPLLGDDLESQMGATVIHRAILETLRLKGLAVSGTYQMNVGGNMDFQNLVERGQSKQKSKLRGLMLPVESGTPHVIPAAGFFPFLGDRKIAHIHVEAEGWLGLVNSLDIQLEIHDSCSAASALADLLRIAKHELDNDSSGLVLDAGFYFKSAVSKSDLRTAYEARSRYLADLDNDEPA